MFVQVCELQTPKAEHGCDSFGATPEFVEFGPFLPGLFCLVVLCSLLERNVYKSSNLVLKSHMCGFRTLCKEISIWSRDDSRLVDF